MTLLLSYYGDDFTGSTDTMEALASHGIRTVLFTRLPTAAETARFAGYEAMGLAGTSRSQTPEWMERNLPAAFTWLKGLGAGLCHYKVCSTFDSSPSVGNIGRATEIGQRVFGQQAVPLIVGVPQLKRFTFAGHLFAAYQGRVYRIDRHPVMSRHPVTPMDEADLCIHLGRQTERPVQLASADLAEPGLHLIDVDDAETQLQAGRILLNLPEQARPFVVGSSGVEYAFVKALIESGHISGKADFPALGPVARTAVVSGSVSPHTERQIRHALAHGFAGVAADAVALAAPDNRPEFERLLAEATDALEKGAIPLVYTASGHASDRGREIDAIPEGRHRLGSALGQLLRVLIERFHLTRAIIAGGDTSGHALGGLDVFALTTRYPLRETPGSPLCIAHSGNATLANLELALKGGQLGGEDYFVKLRDGVAG